METAMLESLKTGEHMAMQAVLTLLEGPTPEPTTIQEALASPEWPDWNGAMEIEINALIVNGVRAQLERPKDNRVV